jgi:hypothetical protein
LPGRPKTWSSRPSTRVGTVVLRTERGTGGPRRVGVALVTAALLLIVAGTAWPQGSLEAAVKAAYLFKFPLFVEWPQAAGATRAFVLCVVGEDPFRGVLDEAATGQRVGGRPVLLRRLPAIGRGSDCDVLFASGSPVQSVAAILETVRSTPVLTVTDSERLGGPPGIIDFVIVNNRVRFSIDDAAAAANGLAISSKLLSLAVVVRPRT